MTTTIGTYEGLYKPKYGHDAGVVVVDPCAFHDTFHDVFCFHGTEPPPPPFEVGAGTDITLYFDEAWFEGSSQPSDSTPFPFPVALNGRGLALDLKYYQRETVDVFREARDTQALPGEGSLNPQGAWKRTRDDWSMGTGQTWADRDASNDRRFHRSIGLDIWTEQNAICMLPDTERYVISTSTNLLLLSVGTHLYSALATNITRTTDPSATIPVFDTISAGAAVVDMTTDGNNVYVAVTGAIKKSAISGTTIAAFGGAAGSYTAQVLEYANGWLFASNNNTMKQVNADGTMADVKVHTNTGFIWSAISGSPAFIYIGGQATDLAEIYRVGVNDTGALTVPVYAGTLPRGELLRAMVYYGDKMLLGTSRGIRVAAINNDGSLSHGPLIEIGDIESLYGDGQFVWFTWSNYDSEFTGLGRVNLAEFSSPGVPAYATDLMWEGQGTVTSVARFGGRTYFAVSGQGFIRETVAQRAAVGRLELGRFRWGTFEPKVFLGLEVTHEPLDGRLDMQVLLDDGTIITVGARTTQGLTGVGDILGVGRSGNTTDWIEPVVIFSRAVDEVNEGPCVQRITARGLPVPKQIDQFLLPVIVAETVDLGNADGQDFDFDTRELYNELHFLHSRGLPVTYQEGNTSYVVTVRKVEWPQGMAARWNSERDGFEGIAFVTVDTAEI